MRNLVNIENIKGLARDITSHAVVSTSSEVFNDYHRRKSLTAVKNTQLEKQQAEIDIIKNDINDIKTMLQALMQR